jgi:hypothetical protein
LAGAAIAAAGARGGWTAVTVIPPVLTVVMTALGIEPATVSVRHYRRAYCHSYANDDASCETHDALPRAAFKLHLKGHLRYIIQLTRRVREGRAGTRGRATHGRLPQSSTGVAGCRRSDDLA